MEHSLHLAAKHFVEAVAPASSSTIRKKVKDALKRSRHNGEVDLDEFDDELSQINVEELVEDGDMDSGDEFNPGDSLGKAIALVKQVSSRIFN